MICNVEVWKVIDNYPDYEVSNKGRVRSWRKSGPHGGRRNEPKILAYNKHRGGYQMVILCRKGSQKKCTVHRLVLAAFDKSMPSEIDCCHKNGNPSDNRVENLYWGTRKENMADQLIHGTRIFGERNGSAKLTGTDALAIAKDPRTQQVIAADYGVSRDAIQKIKSGKTWSSVTGITYQTETEKS